MAGGVVQRVEGRNACVVTRQGCGRPSRVLGPKGVATIADLQVLERMGIVLAHAGLAVRRPTLERRGTCNTGGHRVTSDQCEMSRVSG